MKLGRIAVDGPDGSVARLVLVHPGQGCVVDLAAAHRRSLVERGASEAAARRLAAAMFPESMTAALGAGEVFLASCRDLAVRGCGPAAHAIEDVTWLPPVDPPVLRDFNAFACHDPTTESAWSRQPLHFKINPSTVVGHRATVPWPAACEYMDFELELGLVIGTAGHDLTPETALSHVVGVTALNDFSIRNLLLEELPGRLGPAKGKDFATALGPWLVTTDELDPEDLTMSASVNGVEWARGTTASMTWRMSEIVAHASTGERVVPGEVIGTGTVRGGSGWELGRRLEPGDRVELRIEGIGVLANTVGEPAATGWRPRPRSPRAAGVSGGS